MTSKIQKKINKKVLLSSLLLTLNTTNLHTSEQYKGILFDLDDTLVDFKTAEKKAY